MRPHIGLQVTPAIRLTRPLGTGGMGSVWVGRHSGLDANVAVKFLSADLLTNEGALRRFANEASVTAQIKSPHVVQIHDHGILGGELPFIVMELLEGVDLGAQVENRGPFGLAAAALLVQQLGQVLARAHAAGIVHRDVKPENVFLLDGYGDLFLKLIDFGIAKQASRDHSLTVTGMMVGTPDFMCPEQLTNAKDVGPQADLWALAGVAYYALSGARPFHRQTVPATLLAIEKGALALPFAALGKGNEALDAFFSRALCRDPAARFASLGELVAAFCEAVQVPTARTLLLAAGGDAPLSLDQSSEPASGRVDSAITRPDLPFGARAPSGTWVGSAASSSVDRSIFSLVGVREAERTRESAGTAQEPIETAPATPAAIAARRRALARRVLVALTAALILCAWFVQYFSPNPLPEPREAPTLGPLADPIAVEQPSEPPPASIAKVSDSSAPEPRSLATSTERDESPTVVRKSASRPRRSAPPVSREHNLKDRGF